MSKAEWEANQEKASELFEEDILDALVCDKVAGEEFLLYLDRLDHKGINILLETWVNETPEGGKFRDRAIEELMEQYNGVDNEDWREDR